MVKSLRRNFITVLLLACVIFSLILPIAAADAAPTEYNRAYLGETPFGKSVTDVLTDYSVAYDTVSDLYKTGFSQAYQYLIDLFGTGGTNKAGVAQAAALPMTDSNGYAWYSVTFVPVSVDVSNSGAVQKRTAQGNLIIDYFSKLNATGDIDTGTYYMESFPCPRAGSYRYYLDVSESTLNTRIQYAAKFVYSSGGFSDVLTPMSDFSTYAMKIVYLKGDSTASWLTGSSSFRFYIVMVDSPSGTAFSGFGGGQARGGGAGRKYNLIPAAKADAVAVGSGVSRVDVLADYALFDEGTKAVSIPQADGTTVNYTANTWVYNYETRTYNITTTNNTTVNITYCDDKASVTDGTNSPVDYYYTAPVSSGGDSGGDSGGGFWDKILGGLADGILAFFKAVGVVLASILTGLVDLLTSAVESIGSLVALVGSLGAVVGGFFAFLPVEVQAAVSAGLIVVITFSVISVIRK